VKNPAYGQIQARTVKARVRMPQHAQGVSGNVSQTCYFFGVSRSLFYIRKKRYEKNGLEASSETPKSNSARDLLVVHISTEFRTLDCLK
jgi:hypothetical protein